MRGEPSARDAAPDRKPSLRRQLLLGVGGIVLLTVLLIAVAAWRAVVLPAEDEVAEQAMRLASGHAGERINALVHTIESVTLTGREWGQHGLLKIEGHEQFREVFLPVLQSRPEILNVLLAREDGRQLALARTDKGWDLRQYYPNPKGNLQHWIHLDPRGSYVGEEWQQTDYDPRKRPWYTGAMRIGPGQKVYWTDVYPFAHTLDPGITTSAAWIDRNDGVRYVIAADIALSDLSRMISSIDVGSKGEIALLSTDGKLIGLTRNANASIDANIAARLLRTPAEAGLARFAAAWALWEAGERPLAQPLRFDFEGEPWFALFEGISLGERNLVVAVVAPHSEFAVGKPWHLAVILAIALVAFGVAMVIAGVGSRRVTRVLGELAAESERIGNLELDRPVRVRATSSEFGKLVVAQERMREALLEATHHLERKVRKRTEALTEREAFVSALLESSPSGLILGTREGATRMVSSKWTEMLGYTVDDLGQSLVSELYVDPKDREPFIAALERDGKVRDYECRFRRKDGSEFWGLLNSSFVHVGNERLLATWVHDVTVQREAAERVRLLADEQQAILDNLQVGVIFSADGKIVRANRKYAEIFGYETVDELLGRPTALIWASQEALAAFARDYGPVLGQGKSVDTEVAMRRADGQVITCRLIGQPIAGTKFGYSTVWIIEDVTERRAANARVAAARAQLQAIMDGTPALMFMKDADGRYQRVNRAFADFFGLEFWQILEHTDRSIFPRDAAERVEADDRVFASGDTVHIEERMRGADGRDHDFLTSKFALLGDDGKPYALAGVATDITPQKKAEREIAGLLSLMEAMIDSVPYPMFYNDADSRFLGCNKAYEEAFGIRREHLTGRRVVDLDLKYLDDSRRREYQAELEKIIAQGLTVRREAVFPYADGAPHHSLYSATGFRKPDGSPGGLVGVFVDIEPLKQTERALNDALERQKTILETSPHGVAVVRDRAYVQTNPSLERMLGYAPGELIGQPTRITYDNEEVFRSFGARAYAALQRGEVFADEFRLVRKDGSRLWGRITAAALDRTDPLKGTLGIYEDVTEAHDAAEALKQALDRQRTIFEASPHGIALIEERRYTIVSRNLERMFGYVPGEMIDKSTRIVFPSDAEFEQIGARLYDAMKQGESLAQEAQLVRKDGTRFWCRITGAPLDPQNPRKGTVGIYEDVTEAREAAEALKQALERQERIFAASPHGIATFAQRRFVLASPALERMFGYAPGEMHGKLTRVIYSSDEEYEQVGKDVYGSLRSGAPLHVQETQLVRKDGTRFWGRITAGALDRDDPMKGLIAVYEDISERKAAERALQAANDEQQAIFESATSGIALIKDRVILRCNQRMEEVFGFAPGEMLGKPTRIWYTSDEEAAKGGRGVYEQIWQGRTHRREQQFVRKDGTLFWCRLTGRAVDATDQSRGTVWMLEDVTDELAAAEALREAKRVAEEATNAKSMFLANMSHEIRTPMNAVIGMAHLALRTELTPKQRDYVQKIHNAGTSLLGVINDVLDFSKIEAGKLDMEAIDFSLDDALANLTTIVGQKVADKGLELLIDVPAALPRDLIGDPLRIGQILVNLVNNAVKFTERGEIAVRVQELERTGEKLKLQISVRDTGIGMTREQCGKLFQAFAQADGSTTRKYGGTGLGLTICKRLVELMGGTIWVDSEPGAGSHFQFTAWLGLSAKRHARRKVVPDALNGLRVLVVDDSAAARDMVLDALADKPFDLRGVNSGEEAIAEVEAASAQGRPVDLVFMDWRMPGMSGTEAALRIKEHKALSSIPRVVMVTAFGRDEVRQEADRAQADGFMVKPVSASALVDTIIALFAREEPAAEPVSSVVRKSWGLQGLRVLLAEDNEINQQIAIELLESEGAKVEVANNGRDAVAKTLAAVPPYDAVLMDLQMPDMGGIEATLKIRQHKDRAQVPIIAMTAHAMAEERQNCLDAGMQDHITKPIDPDTLFRTLAAWCGSGAQAATAISTPGPVPKHDAVLPGISGLDAEGGLRRVGGNSKFYLKILRQYLEQQSDAPSAIRRSLSGGDRKTAERIAHTAKGVSGTIGADRVQHAAADLESAIANGGDAAPLLACFESELLALITPLRSALAEVRADAPISTGSVDAGSLRPVLERLAALLAASSGKAVNLLSSEEAILKVALGSGFPALEKAVNDFDFDAALEQLKTSAGRHNIAL